MFGKTTTKPNASTEERWRRNPDNVAVIVRYAGFLWDVRKDYDEAERLDRKALELAPTDLWVSANHTQFLLRRGRFEEALTFSEGPWKLQQGGAGRRCGPGRHTCARSCFASMAAMTPKRYDD